ncbi:MAG: phosphatase PAP2 family protein [Chitinophagales bacterium]
MIADWLQHVDEKLFLGINHGWSSAFCDFILIPIRDKYFWIPAYALIAVWLVIAYRKNGLILILLLGVNFALSDQLSSAVVKPMVGRVRPCNDEQFGKEVDLRVDVCGHGKSFTSSHATNTFAFAVLLGLLMRKKRKFILYAALIWASLVSVAQVYVGVHYPMDILGGALLGTAIAFALFTFARRGLFHRMDWTA